MAFGCVFGAGLDGVVAWEAAVEKHDLLVLDLARQFELAFGLLFG